VAIFYASDFSLMPVYQAGATMKKTSNIIALLVIASVMSCGGDSSTGGGSVEVISISFRNILNTAGEYNIRFDGTVTNTGNKAVREVKVSVTFYDASDRVIPVNTFLDFNANIPPRQSWVAESSPSQLQPGMTGTITKSGTPLYSRDTRPVSYYKATVSSLPVPE
jgi:hypothetical protein